MDVQIKADVHPSTAIAEMEAHFRHLSELEVEIPDFIQGMMLLSRLPPSYSITISIFSIGAMADSHENINFSKVREMVISNYETRNPDKGKGKNGASANKATAIKCKRDQGKPKFAQQQQQPQHQSGSSESSSTDNKDKGKTKCGGGKGKDKSDKAHTAGETSHVANMALTSAVRNKRMHRPVTQPPSTCFRTTSPDLTRAIRLRCEIGVTVTVENLWELLDVINRDTPVDPLSSEEHETAHQLMKEINTFRPPLANRILERHTSSPLAVSNGGIFDDDLVEEIERQPKCRRTPDFGHVPPDSEQRGDEANPPTLSDSNPVGLFRMPLGSTPGTPISLGNEEQDEWIRLCEEAGNDMEILYTDGSYGWGGTDEPNALFRDDVPMNML
ncbi:hypothetical protein K488DRAFT_92266 [Vararia minispora EC-137]|uniref:Uncharacterized protein n=1 Tax=Vararia minispora EC-137 TaxID=1314806 RepID=A0ACB8Q4J1_9AGAM|nr:hypothetical protein K488DRAFT_92266 [Vararia minispora EC-137]